MKRVFLFAVVLVVVASTLCAESVSAELQIGQQFSSRHPHSYPTKIPQGCAMCRGTGNCSNAVGNNTAGVYCGDLITTFQPCCCQYRNECMTTIFSDRCECLSSEEVEQFVSARFTMFCIFTAVMWIALIWDRMCGRPYKVMNSNRHHMLADSPTAAQIIGGNAPRETADGQELLEIDHSEEAARRSDAIAEEEEEGRFVGTPASPPTSESATNGDQMRHPQQERVVDGRNGPREVVVDLQEATSAASSPRRDLHSIQSV